MAWKPEGWKNPYQTIFPQPSHEYEQGIFEAGADAMFEAIKREGTPTGLPYTAYANERKGWLVFIPDDKDG